MSVSGRFEDLVPLRPWEMTWNGRTWRDMPGGDETMQKCAFALYRRGLLESEESKDEDDVVESGARRLVPMHKGCGGARRVKAAVARGEAYRERVAEMEEKRQAEEVVRRLQGRLQMRLTVWGARNGALEQIAARAQVDSGTVSKLRLTGRGIGGERAERLAAVLDDLEAGVWVLRARKRAVVAKVACPPGHVPFKEYLVAAAAARGVKKHSYYVWLKRNPAEGPPIVKVHGRAWFVPCSAMPSSAKVAGVSVSKSPSLKVSKSERRAA